MAQLTPLYIYSVAASAQYEGRGLCNPSIIMTTQSAAKLSTPALVAKLPYTPALALHPRDSARTELAAPPHSLELAGLRAAAASPAAPSTSTLPCKQGTCSASRHALGAVH